MTRDDIPEPVGDMLTNDQLKKLEGNPLKNKEAILIVKQPDGNYRGFMNKNNKIVQARQSDPGNVLQALIIHP